jgi:hypothetical protein
VQKGCRQDVDGRESDRVQKGYIKGAEGMMMMEERKTGCGNGTEGCGKSAERVPKGCGKGAERMC